MGNKDRGGREGRTKGEERKTERGDETTLRIGEEG